MVNSHNKNTVRWGMMFFATVFFPLLITASTAGEIPSESLTSSRMISKPALAQDTPAVDNPGSTGGEKAHMVADAAVTLAIAEPPAQVALSLPVQPATELLALGSAANLEMYQDKYKPVLRTGMSAVTGRADDGQGFTANRRADPSGLTYAIAMALFACLGMVSVARRDTPPSLSSKSQRNATVRNHLNVHEGKQGLLFRVVNRLRRFLGTDIRMIRNVK